MSRISSGQWRVVVCAIVMALVCGQAARAQEAGASATLRGRILDAQGNGVGARVVATQATTGIARETRAESTGYFTLPSLPPGDVVVTIVAQGFAEWRGLLAVSVGQVAQLDVTLTL